MKYQNPFKIIQQENIERFNKIAPKTPNFLFENQNGNLSSKNYTPPNNSPQFPSFG